MNTFARKLKALRTEHQLTQAQMAEKMCVDASRISRREQGGQPTTQFIERLNKVFGVNAFEWLEDDEDLATDAPVPRVVHLNATSTREENDETSWRTKTVELLTRMMDLLGSLTRNSRGGGELAISAHPSENRSALLIIRPLVLNFAQPARGIFNITFSHSRSSHPLIFTETIASSA